MKITGVESFILHVPVTGDGIADSMHRLSHWGVPGVKITTDESLTGYGYTGTHADLALDRLIASCIDDVYAPLLLGADPREVVSITDGLAARSTVLWIGRSGVTTLALSAVDVALWDLKAKAAGQPLWMLLGGSASRAVEGYNTDGGWLDRTEDQLRDEASRLVGSGYRGVKIKVGHDDPAIDIRRVAAVRAEVGESTKVMVDANGRWNLPTAIRAGRGFDELGVVWFEEPLWYDDVPGHRTLASKIDTPIALGEQLSTLDSFRDFVTAGAVHFVQPDAVRLAGITEFWRVADLAHAFRLPVAPHVGDMVQVHLQLAIAHPAVTTLEYIPWLRPVMEEPVEVIDGTFAVPEAPGAGTTLRADALDRFGVR